MSEQSVCAKCGQWKSIHPTANCEKAEYSQVEIDLFRQLAPIVGKVPQCNHRKRKLIDFNEETFVATYKCRCGHSWTSKAKFVCR